MKAYLKEMKDQIRLLNVEKEELAMKYQKYKQKYQHLQRNQSELTKNIENQKVKIGAYDQLVLKLQKELHESMSGRQRGGPLDTAYTQATTIQEDVPFRKGKD